MSVSLGPSPVMIATIASLNTCSRGGAPEAPARSALLIAQSRSGLIGKLITRRNVAAWQVAAQLHGERREAEGCAGHQREQRIGKPSCRICRDAEEVPADHGCATA